MDCVTFRKLIGPYLEGSLTDEELNGFLCHLRSCPECRDELEINYIVIEGLNILDEDRLDYDLSKAYDQSIRYSERYIRFKKHLLTFRYMIDTICFWALAAITFFYFYTLSGMDLLY